MQKTEKPSLKPNVSPRKADSASRRRRSSGTTINTATVPVAADTGGARTKAADLKAVDSKVAVPETSDPKVTGSQARSPKGRGKKTSHQRRTPAGPARSSRALPPITYPEELPVSLRRDDITAAINNHQVVIVSGETGSGKTTQLPKICLELGRGQEKMIGHTQPRRLAATSVARRIAQELNTELGDWVGYQIRFTDRTSSDTAIKLMTDGILLAESQRDPLLRQYDTIIIDEAHERSLNIDFLLGFLKQLLVRRKDLKVIITSATIDAQRFSDHFAMDGKPAPVIDVSGRLFPVDVLYQPIQSDVLAPGDSSPDADVQKNSRRGTRHAQKPSGRAHDADDERDVIDAVVDAVEHCEQHGAGDVLVFLPGEREIRETLAALNKNKTAAREVLPLFARLSRTEQERIFSPQSNVRRIVLATNVAETSLTVPGIRYVVDSGLARIKRYSWRNKVEQLRIEPISQASANQRAGRCGRVGPGVCIRLYSEEDYKSRDAFTDPEILRSSLASVILRMKALKLQDVEEFPFVDPPHGRAIADGYHLLQELGALDEQRMLTGTGAALARLPLDPRLARMILAANEQQCLTEMLVITSALSVQDPRDRPMTERDAAAQAHAQFKDDKSEFLSYVKLWRWYEEQQKARTSQRQLTALLRQKFLSPMRLREWRDVHTQLATLIKEQAWRPNQTDATYEQVHTALLAGLLGNIGTRTDDGNMYQGARDIRFMIHPGSDLVKKAGRWIVAGELVETSRLFARSVARIEPTWIETVGAHLIRRAWSDPRWEKRSGQVVANERATLYGLQIYAGRRVHFGRIDAVQAREIFIQHALVPGDIATTLPFVRHNRQLVAAIEKLEHQTRRPDILVDNALIYAFYDAQLPSDVYQTVTLERWYKGLDKAAQQALRLDRDALMRHDAAGITTDVFPRKVVWQGAEMALDYHFEPGSVRDGVTLSVPLFTLNQIDPERCEWLVPGMLKEKVQLLLRSLPQRIRRRCVPLPDYAEGFFKRWFERAADPQISLLDALALDMNEQLGIRPARSDFKPETLPAHLFMNFNVVDEHGRMLSGGRNLDQLKAEHQLQAQASFQEVVARDQDVAQALNHEGLTSWTFGDLPELLEIRRNGQSFIGYPALVDKGTHCDLDVFDDPDQARVEHQAGLLRLFRLVLREQVRYLEKNINDLTQMGMLYMSLGTLEDLRDQIIDKAIEQACLETPWPTNEAEFVARCEHGKGRLGLLAQEIARLIKQILMEWAAVQKKLPTVKGHAASYDDMQGQLRTLMVKHFIRNTPYTQLRHFPRYLKAVQVRIDKLRTDPQRDARWSSDMATLLTQYQRRRTALKGKHDAALDDFAWMLQELRVALFAQELRTPAPVSVKRLQRAWDAMNR